MIVTLCVQTYLQKPFRILFTHQKIQISKYKVTKWFIEYKWTFKILPDFQFQTQKMCYYHNRSTRSTQVEFIQSNWVRHFFTKI